MRCPTCGADGQPGDRFCENDGTLLIGDNGRLAVVSAVCALSQCGCGIRQANRQGLCQRCGEAIVTPKRKTVELSPRLALATDRGRRHPTNQDAAVIGLAELEQAQMPVLVVCDGVSSARYSDRAAQVAAWAAWEVLGDWVTLRQQPAEEAMRCAIRSASQAIVSLDSEGHQTLNDAATETASATIVAAVVAEGWLTIGWVGDSRAYWCHAGAGRLLTRDHSWVVEEVDAGRLNPALASTDPMAHTLTRWLGPGAADEPAVVAQRAPGEGVLVVCSDGLWNYLPSADRLAALVGRSQAAGRDAAGVAQRLVAHAVAAGGKDNVTVGVALF